MFNNKIFQTIKRDSELEEKITQDMKENAGVFFPHSHWDNVNSSFINSKDDSLTSLLDDFIGSEGLKPIDKQQRTLYEKYFEAVDNLNLRFHLDDGAIATDYGSVMDINLINTFSKNYRDGTFKVCEVGGGYGRLARVFSNFYKDAVKYVLVDSVPVSIMFSYLYLSDQCPDAKIGFYYNGDDFDLDKYDIYIIPSWHFERLNNEKYDIAVNIESMQEMNFDEIQRFMSIFDRCVKDDGTIYLSNSKEYVHKGNWPYPDGWDCQFRQNTPRSWTKKHPTEVFKKTDGSFSEKESLFEFYSNLEELYEMGFDGNSTQFLSRRSLEELLQKSYADNAYLSDEKEKADDIIKDFKASKLYKLREMLK
ncbi:putative sugar O-methyltransferase [Vibrio pectenicida]|uniref:putative sugar O-methyltransferase n=1 Tax=Vibrio pectenicida TaxID=62763 RepID=UPI003B999FD0